MRISDWSSDVCSSDLANHSAFGEQLAERARWRIEHDFHRLDALSERAAEAGMTLPDDACLRDPAHLEERLASLCTERARHPVAGDSRLRLGAAGGENGRRSGRERGCRSV